MKLAVHLSYSGSTYALDLPKVLEAERLTLWTSAGMTTLMVGGDVTALRVMAELTL